MTGKKILAIGAHIGDMELTAGGVMASNALNGGKNLLLALTAGERGNPPSMSQATYRLQKIEEAKEFASMVNGEAIVFDYLDGELPNNEEVRLQIAQVIRDFKPDVIITHWQSTMHKDHNNTHLMVPDAAYYAGTDIGPKLLGPRHYAPVYFAENWEDVDNFEPYLFVDITAGYDLWTKAIAKHWFIMNSPWFSYFDYYTSLARVRGCLNKTTYAECFTVFERQKRVKKDMI